MKFYYLESKHDWPQQNTVKKFVVQAVNKVEARKVASYDCGSEGPDVWLDPSKTICEELTLLDWSHVVLREIDPD